jgi:hypothetical protein
MKKNLLYLVCILFLVTSCANPYLKNSSNVSKIKKSYDKVLVVAKAKDKVARMKFEDQVVKDLAIQGISAYSSMSMIKTESFSKEISDSELEKLKNKLVKDGYDGVIVTNLINAQQYTDVTQGSVGTAYVPVRYGRFGRYYGAYPVSYWGADEVETGVEYTLESCLYDLTVDQKENLQWVGRFQVKNPTSLMKAVEKYSGELTEALLTESIAK